MKLGIVAGEASGDLLGQGLLKALKNKVSVEASGIAGPLMLQEGCHSLALQERLAVMGIIEPLFRLRELLSIRRQILDHFSKNKPDVFVGIDAPDFNLHLEYKLKKQGIPVVHYVSPSVWAWRLKRIHKIAKATNLVLTLFPFELAFYEKHHVNAAFVGHPLADSIPFVSDKQSARIRLGLAPNATYIALLPGSRKNEITFLGELFFKTAALSLHQNKDLHFISSAANTFRLSELNTLQKKQFKHLSFQVFLQKTQDVMAAADIILVGAGTATLEAMLIKRPMIIAYRTSFLTYEIAKRLVKVPFIGLPNLLAGKMLVPELIQEQATPEAITKLIFNLLGNTAQNILLHTEFRKLHQQLRLNTNEKCAAAILNLLN